MTVNTTKCAHRHESSYISQKKTIFVLSQAGVRSLIECESKDCARDNHYGYLCLCVRRAVLCSNILLWCTYCTPTRAAEPGAQDSGLPSKSPSMISPGSLWTLCLLLTDNKRRRAGFWLPLVFDIETCLFKTIFQFRFGE